MAAKTEQFKSAGSNLGRTIGQSLSMITGKDIPNYSLLFLDATLSRKRGEHETIFMPHIVLGRSSRCHVRYGDDQKTVSREHASITVDGSNFVINHNPSASNPTYVNGRAIGGAHHLQNGDEIQLSSNGPKMRFNASTLKTSTIGLTSRIGQAMSQAVKPYKTALWVMGLLLLGALGLAGYNMYQNANMKNELIALNLEKEKIDQEIELLVAKGEANSEEMERLKKEKAKIIYRTNIIREKAPELVSSTRNDDTVIESSKPVKPDETKPINNSTVCNDEVELNKVLPKGDVALIILKRLEIKHSGSSGSIGVSDFFKDKTNNPEAEDRSGILSGTGFVTSNGKLITARHVVQPWRFYNENPDENVRNFWKQINAIEQADGTIEAYFNVIFKDKTEQITFRTGQITHDNDDLVKFDDSKKGKKDKKSKEDTKDIKIDIFKDDKTQKFKTKSVPNETKVAKESHSDWASLPFNASGNIILDAKKSETLLAGTKIYVLGFSHNIGAFDATRWTEPSYATSTVSNNSTLNKAIAISGLTFGPGNSGGPAFICQDGEIICIGVAVKSVGSSNGILVPVRQIRN